MINVEASTVINRPITEVFAFVGEAAGPAKPFGSFLFGSVGGDTKLTLLPRPEFRGFFRLLEPMMAGYVRKQNEEHLSNLKRLLET